MDDGINKLAGTEVTFSIPNTESLASLKDMTPKVSLNFAYRMEAEWETLKGKPIRAFYLGIKQIPNPEGNLVNCGLFASSTEIFLAGGIILIVAIKNLPLKTPLQLTYLGTKETKADSNNRAVTFDIQILG